MTNSGTRPLRGIVKRQAEERERRARHDALLGPVAEVYAEFDQVIEEYVRGLPDPALADLDEATTGLTETNCWWAKYHVAPMVQVAVRREAWRRRKASGRASGRSSS